MKKVNKDVLKDAANRLLFDLSDEQYDVLLDEFNIIISQLKLMNKVKGLSKLEPMTFPFPCEIDEDELRDDEPCAPLDKEDVLKNATSKVDDQIKLPKVV